MSDTLNAARIVAYTAAITASGATSGDIWVIGVAVAGIVLVEILIYAQTLVNYLRGRLYESLVADAAARAVQLIETERRNDSLLNSIAALRGTLPDHLVDAAEAGRLNLSIEDDQ